MNIAILGVGTVGEAVVRILNQNKKIITARSGEEIKPIIGVVRNLKKVRNVGDLELTDDIYSVINRNDIDVFVELMGGVDEPKRVVSHILKRGKAVVTANKALLAYHRYALQNLAGTTPFGFEASVAGGIPIIRALREGLSANHILSINGILNGTSNYILTSMMGNGSNFADALKKAQELGYAEADPTFDIGGFDAAHKLLILASIELRVHPTLVPKDKMIAKTNGVTNAISVIGDAVGETMFYGPGAGGNATASAVISDLIDIARDGKSPMLGYKAPFELNSLKLLEKDKIRTKYYFRLHVKDEVGVLAKITNLMSENNLSIDSVLQTPREDNNSHAILFFTTHTSLEADVQKTIEILKHKDFIKDEPFMIRIES